MRIIADTKKGMKLLSPKTQISWPITDQVKESLFSVLYKYDLPEGDMLVVLLTNQKDYGFFVYSKKINLTPCTFPISSSICSICPTLRKQGDSWVERYHSGHLR